MFTPDTPATRQAFNRLAREKMKQFNIERFSREMRLYARLLARLADATDEAEPWRAAGAGGGEEGRWKA